MEKKIRLMTRLEVDFANSVLADKTFIDTGVRKNLGIIIDGINKVNCSPVFNPSPETVIEADDVLITLGKSPEITNLEEITSGTG